MTKDKVRSTEEALKLALDALEKSHTCPLLPDDCAEAITAIKKALMSHSDGAQPEQEPDYYGLTADHLWMSISKDHYDRLNPEYRMTCYTTPPPVAEPHKRPSRSDIKPLTDDEIILIVAECASSHQHTDIHLARAIEQAHGIIAPTELKGEA